MCLFFVYFLLASKFALGGEHHGIIEYHPVEFTEQFSTPVFYTVGYDLKFGTSIEQSGRTIYRFSSRRPEGMHSRPMPIMEVSPDANKIIIYDQEKLLIAEANGKVFDVYKNIGNLSTPTKTPPFGGYFQSFQWSPDSKFIFVIIRNNATAASYTSSAKIIRIESAPPFGVTTIADGLASFHAYFSLNEDAICYDHYGEDRHGPHQWKCTNGEVIKSIENESICFVSGSCTKPNQKYLANIKKNDFFRKNIDGFVFVETRSSCKEHGILSERNATATGAEGTTTYTFKGRKLFVINGWHNIKGTYMDGTNCLDVMPGERYATFNLYTDDFVGVILVDGQTGQYKELPRFTTILGPLE